MVKQVSNGECDPVKSLAELLGEVDSPGEGYSPL